VPALVDDEVREAAAHGVGSFLAVHEECGGGFSIARNGRGRLHLLCNECGAHTEYGAEASEALKAHGVDPAVTVGARRFRPDRESVERWLPAPAALPWWVPNAYILAVIAIGLAMVAFGVLHRRGDDRAILSQSPPPQSTAPGSAGPAPRQAQAAPGSSAPASGSGRERPSEPPDLHRIVVLERFSVGVPPGWEGGLSGGAVVFRSASSDAELRVFFQSGMSPRRELSGKAADFLSDEHRGAHIGETYSLRFGETRGIGVVARYPGGRESAAVLAANGYSYLVLSRIDGDASAGDRASTAAAVQSLRPL
jgi:hypothetical protein